MSTTRQIWEYYATRLRASLEHDHDRGEVSATTVVMAAALIALALFVGFMVLLGYPALQTVVMNM